MKMSDIPEYIEKKVWKDGYPEGFPSEIRIPATNFAKLVEESFDKHSDRVFSVYKGEETTYSEVRSSYYSLSRALRDIGIEKNDIVGIFMDNSPEWLISYHGVLRAAAIATGISPLYTTREVGYQLNDSEAENIILHDKYFSTLRDIVEDGGTPEETDFGENLEIERIIVVGNEEKDISIEGIDIYYLENLIESYEPEPPDVEIEKGDTAVLQYTGGTTGRPKGCVLSHRNIKANAMQSMAWHDYVCDQAGVERLTALSVLPWYHIYGQTIEVNTGVVAGERTVIPTDFDAEEWMRLIEKHECSLFLGVPTTFLMMTNHPKFEEYDLSSLTWVVSGAAPLPQETVRKFKEIHGVIISNGYGLSEASPVTHLTPPFRDNREEKGVLAVGIGYPNTLYGIIDLKEDEPEFLPFDNTGELVVSGPQVMKNYWNRPGKTNEVIFEAGGRKWLKTGDVAYIDGDGYTYPIDRKSQIIEYEGQVIYPREIEELFFTHSAVDDIAVIEVPSPSTSGNQIKAFVVLNKEYEDEIGEEELLEFARENLEEPKRPDSIGFLDQIPKTESGKYLKRKLVDEEVFGEDLGVTSY